jgi:hypothetical protein
MLVPNTLKRQERAPIGLGPLDGHPQSLTIGSEGGKTSTVDRRVLPSICLSVGCFGTLMGKLREELWTVGSIRERVVGG